MDMLAPFKFYAGMLLVCWLSVVVGFSTLALIIVGVSLLKRFAKYLGVKSSDTDF